MWAMAPILSKTEGDQGAVPSSGRLGAEPPPERDRRRNVVSAAIGNDFGTGCSNRPDSPGIGSAAPLRGRTKKGPSSTDGPIRVRYCPTC
jgi:hypothetical protein